MNNNHQHQERPSLEKPGEEDVFYTCPMHPEIRQKNFGICPICGMKLVPEAGSKSKKTD